MKFDLAAMARRAGLKRRETTFAPIITTEAQHKTLARINRAIIAPWSNARRRLGEIYDRELRRTMQQDAIDDLTTLFDSLGEQVDRLIIELTPTMRDFAIELESWHRGKWSRSLLAGTEVEIAYLIGPNDAQETIDQFMARNTALIRNISDETRGRIADLVYRGLQQRTPSNKVGREIAKRLGMGRQRANRVAADQSVKLAAALDRQRQREAGLDHWKWRHSGKLHYRPDHKARDGNLYTDKTAPEDEPGELPYCGCVRQGVLILDDD